MCRARGVAAAAVILWAGSYVSGKELLTGLDQRGIGSAFRRHDAPPICHRPDWRWRGPSLQGTQQHAEQGVGGLVVVAGVTFSMLPGRVRQSTQPG